MLAFVAGVMSAAPVHAGGSYRPFEQPASTYTADFGLRFWYGSATTGKNLYDSTGSFLVSRLTYGDLSIYAAEVYGRVDYDRRWFLKGYAGGGGFRQGNLKDEDFPPAIAPYSATFSVEQNSAPFYGAIDAGFNALWGPDFRVGFFGGFHYLNHNISAFGCTQAAFNPQVCGPFPIPNTIEVITQDNNWYSVRVGLDAAIDIDCVRLSLDAAWLPYVWLSGTDTHWLRVGTFPGNFTGAVPEDGKGWGYQIDAFLSYQLSDTWSVGVGGRYWYMQTHGLTHFEDHVIGFTALPQVVEWKTQNFGIFLQGSMKLGPYFLFPIN